jgi:hypothetical protein
MTVPDLLKQYNFFSHAWLDKAETGPRHELILWVCPFEWGLSGGGWADERTRIRFGGIANFEEVQIFFSQVPEEQLAWIRLNPNKVSKLNNLFYTVAFERTGIMALVHCKNITVDDVASFGAEAT